MPKTAKEADQHEPEVVAAQQHSFLAAALSKAQGQMQAAEKDRVNPHFKSDYATLHSIREAARKPLADNGIAVLQLTAIVDGMIILRTTLLHTSGESATSDYPVCSVSTPPQAIGSALTYARKNALGGITGVAPKENPDDDDGNQAREAYTPSKPKARVADVPMPPAKPSLKDEALAYITKVDASTTWDGFMNVIAGAGDLVERIRAADKGGAWTARINEKVDAKRTELEPPYAAHQEIPAEQGDDKTA